MSAQTAMSCDELLPGVQVRVEAAAGVNLTDSSPWWGSRVYWRHDGERRWERALLVGVHPFDRDAVHAFLEVQLTPGPPRLVTP